jgi:hypothetical protein
MVVNPIRARAGFGFGPACLLAARGDDHIRDPTNSATDRSLETEIVELQSPGIGCVVAKSQQILDCGRGVFCESVRLQRRAQARKT